MKLTIMGLFARQLGLETLQGLVEDKEVVVKAVLSHYYEPDMKAKRPLFQTFVDLCAEHAIPLIVVNQNQETLKFLGEMKFDILVANCYKYIVPEKYLTCAKIASVNMHRSLLPKYPGLKPLKRALENNEEETGTTVHKMVRKVDSGEIIAQSTIPIEKGDDEAALFKKLCCTQYPLLKQALNKLVAQ